MPHIKTNNEENRDLLSFCRVRASSELQIYNNFCNNESEFANF